MKCKICGKSMTKVTADGIGPECISKFNVDELNQVKTSINHTDMAMKNLNNKFHRKQPGGLSYRQSREILALTERSNPEFAYKSNPDDVTAETIYLSYFFPFSDLADSGELEHIKQSLKKIEAIEDFAYTNMNEIDELISCASKDDFLKSKLYIDEKMRGDFEYWEENYEDDNLVEFLKTGVWKKFSDLHFEYEKEGIGMRDILVYYVISKDKTTAEKLLLSRNLGYSVFLHLSMFRDAAEEQFIDLTNYQTVLQNMYDLYKKDERFKDLDKESVYSKIMKDYQKTKESK